MTQYLVVKPLLVSTIVNCLLYLNARFAHVSGGILAQSPSLKL